MSRWIFHPSDADLARYFYNCDTASPRKASVRLRRHLADCDTCRAHVTFLRSLPARIAALEGPEASEALFARIRARCASGEVVILPAASNAAAASRRDWFAIATAMLLVAVTTWLAWPAPDLTALAPAGDLRFAPDRIVSGPIELRYRDPGLFGETPKLRVRARYRTLMGVAVPFLGGEPVVATLTRDADGVYHATVRVPDSVVYAAFSVEGPNGGRVDHNGRRPWHLLMYRGTHPTSEALLQYANDLMNENRELAMSVLQERARLYPDRPGSWWPLVTVERLKLSDAHADSTLAEHCARLQRFDAELRSRPSQSLAEVSDVWRYAVQLHDRACPSAQRINDEWGAWLVQRSHAGSTQPESH
jgi:hypothetical protein